MGVHEISGVDGQQDLSVDVLDPDFVELRIVRLHGLRLYHQRGVEPVRLFAEGVGCNAGEGDRRREYDICCWTCKARRTQVVYLQRR